jgi:hypothetical protein
VILTILRFTDKVTFDAFDGDGARNAPQPGVKAPFHFRSVRSVQIHPLGRKHAAR